MAGSKEKPVAVLGAGVVGLCAGVRLLERGHGVVVYSERRVGETSDRRGLASVAAPAMFTPYTGAEPARLARWCRVSLDEYERLAERPEETGVRMGILREYGYAPHDFAGAFTDLLPERPLERVPPGFACAYDTRRPHILTARLLPWLERRLTELGGRFVKRSVKSPQELLDGDHRVVVNCAGVSAAAVSGDRLVRPLAGQVLHVPNTVGLTRSVQDDARRPGNPNATYVFHYDDRLVLGSTFHEGEWDERVKMEAERDIVERCRELLRIDGWERWRELAAGGVTARHVGLRPGRGGPGVTEDPRVEVEELAGGRRVIHNYGHGRSGVTLAWGCADEVAGWAG
jgi:D-amino-acid oxidase